MDNNITVNKSESEQKRDFRTYARILLKYAPLITISAFRSLDQSETYFGLLFAIERGL